MPTILHKINSQANGFSSAVNAVADFFYAPARHLHNYRTIVQIQVPIANSKDFFVVDRDKSKDARSGIDRATIAAGVFFIATYIAAIIGTFLKGLALLTSPTLRRQYSLLDDCLNKSEAAMAHEWVLERLQRPVVSNSPNNAQTQAASLDPFDLLEEELERESQLKQKLTEQPHSIEDIDSSFCTIPDIIVHPTAHLAQAYLDKQRINLDDIRPLLPSPPIPTAVKTVSNTATARTSRPISPKDKNVLDTAIDILESIDELTELLKIKNIDFKQFKAMNLSSALKMGFTLEQIYKIREIMKMIPLKKTG